jgi:hypothetical protein
MGEARGLLNPTQLNSEQRKFAEWLLADDALLRSLIRQGPDDSTLVFGIILNDERPASTPDWNRKRPDIGGLLEHLRNQKA